MAQGGIEMFTYAQFESYVLFPLAIGIFVYFNVDSNSMLAFIPMIVMMQIIRSQSVKITMIERNITLLKDKYEGEA